MSRGELFELVDSGMQMSAAAHIVLGTLEINVCTFEQLKENAYKLEIARRIGGYQIKNEVEDFEELIRRRIMSNFDSLIGKFLFDRRFFEAKKDGSEFLKKVKSSSEMSLYELVRWMEEEIK